MGTSSTWSYRCYFFIKWPYVMQITPGTTYHRFSIKRKLHVVLAGFVCGKILPLVLAHSMLTTNIVKVHLLPPVVLVFTARKGSFRLSTNKSLTRCWWILEAFLLVLARGFSEQETRGLRHLSQDDFESVRFHSRLVTRKHCSRQAKKHLSLCPPVVWRTSKLNK